MSFIFLKLIEIYWLLIPQAKRKNCLFHESCSRYVYRTLKGEGFLKGLKAFKFRFQNCRPEYEIIKIDDSAIILQFLDGTVLQQEHISENIIKTYKTLIND
jgi:uncharacterized protein